MPGFGTVSSKLDTLWRAWVLRKDPTIWEDNAPYNAARQIMTASVRPPTAGGADGQRVVGRYYFAVQVKGLSGDTAAIEGTLNEADWQTIGLTPAGGGAVITSIVADGLYLFSGPYIRIRATHTGGAGITTIVWLTGEAP